MGQPELLEEVVAPPRGGGDKRTRMDRPWSGSGVPSMPSLEEAKRPKEEERTNEQAGNTTSDCDVEMNDVGVDASATGGPNSMGTTIGGGGLRQTTASLAVNPSHTPRGLSMNEDAIMATGSLDVHPEAKLENVDVSASPSPTGGPSSSHSDAQQEQAEGKSHDSDKKRMLERVEGIGRSGMSKQEIIDRPMSSAPDAKGAEAGSDSEEGSEAGSLVVHSEVVLDGNGRGRVAGCSRRSRLQSSVCSE